MGAVTAIADAVSKFFGWMTGRNAAKNAADVKAAATAQSAVSADDKTNNAIAKKDTDEIRNELAE